MPSARPLRSLAAAVLIVVLVASSAAAAPGDLDTAFSGDGFTVTTFRDSYGVATSVAIQSDGRTVVAGGMHRNVSIEADFALARYTLDGRLDRTFSGNGRARTDFGARFDEALGVAIQADGKIVVVGRASDDIAVARYEADGDLDASFSRNGKRVIDLGGVDAAFDVLPQADGKIVMAGTDGRDFAVLRLREGGPMDAGFGVAGVARTDFGGFQDAARAVAIDAAGGIVAGGSALMDEKRRSDFALARYDSDGALDDDFGDAGLATTDFASFDDGITDIALAPKGAIVASGHAEQFPGDADQASDVALARYEPDGSLDAKFGDAGTVRTDFGSYFDEAEGMALQGDGRIVVAGHFLDGSSDTAALARYEPDGDLDPSFGVGGIAVSGAEVSGDRVGGVALRADGGIVVATAASTGDPDSSFGFLVLQFLAA
jgi:uncharacterized delta-60 repeat protein